MTLYRDIPLLRKDWSLPRQCVRTGLRASMRYAAILGITFSVLSPSAPMAGEEEVFFEVCVPTGGLLHLRSAPSTTSASLGLMENGTSLSYISGNAQDPEAWINVLLFYLQTPDNPGIYREGYVRPRMLAEHCDTPHDPQLSGMAGSYFDGSDIQLGRNPAGSEPNRADFSGQSKDIPLSPEAPRLIEGSADAIGQDNANRSTIAELLVRMFEEDEALSNARSLADNHYTAIRICMQDPPRTYESLGRRLAGLGFQHGEWGGIDEYYRDGLAIRLSTGGRFCDVASEHFGIQATEALVREIVEEIRRNNNNWEVAPRSSGCFQAVRPEAVMTVASGGQDPVCPIVRNGQLQYPDGDASWGSDSAFRIMWE